LLWEKKVSAFQKIRRFAGIFDSKLIGIEKPLSLELCLTKGVIFTTGGRDLHMYQVRL